MSEVRAAVNERGTTLYLSGRIDSGNAAEVESKVMELTAAGGPVVIDANGLEYISSAGLRVILRLKKRIGDLHIIGAGPEVYDILDMTGFTEMMPVEKAYRTVSIEGCEVIGEGFNGKVYRIDRDNVVKTYKNADALAEIRHEREVAKLALILGVPTAISYDVVKVGNSYGSVFELLNAKSFSKLLAGEPEKFDWCVSEYVGMLKKIHSTVVPAGRLPSAKEDMLKAVRRMKDMLPDGLGDKLLRMTEEIPESDRMIHGDFHTKNIVLTGDEVLVIDMDTLSVGHPIFDLVQMYNSYVGFSELDPEIVLAFQGYPARIARRFWHESLAAYLGTHDEDMIGNVERKIRCLAYADLLDWSVRHPEEDPEKDKITSAYRLEQLTQILRTTDSLLFHVSEQEFDADAERLHEVTDFVDGFLDGIDCPMKIRMQIAVAAEEIFINIANYAYAPRNGKASVRLESEMSPKSVTISFIDGGKPFDPTAKPDPDVTLSAEEREIGGLGIFMTKKIMDEVRYEYAGGKNILTMKKFI